jgi:hypothetical protein
MSLDPRQLPHWIPNYNFGSISARPHIAAPVVAVARIGRTPAADALPELRTHV